MNKTALLFLLLMSFAFTGLTQTLGEKFKLPEEAGELRTDGVYHLSTSLLADARAEVEAYFRFYEDGTFIVYHTRSTPKKQPEIFQANCNYDFVATTSAPFNKDYKLKTNGNIARARIGYPDKAILIELDIRKNIIQATLRTFSPSGERIGEPQVHIMPFYEITWPVANTLIKKQK